MSRTSTGAKEACLGRRLPDRPIWWNVLVPGLPQWTWGQRDRATLLGTGYATALGVGLFAWGTWASPALLGFAYLTHLVSAVDAIRQWAFPGFGTVVPAVTTAAGLGAGVYLPAVLAGTLLAWPGSDRGRVFAIDRLAHRDRSPAVGERVWLGQGADRGRVVEVIAGPEDEVRWTAGGIERNRVAVAILTARAGESPRSGGFRVPARHVLVAYRRGDGDRAVGWELAPVERIGGRAWAQLVPIWERRWIGVTARPKIGRD